MPDAYENINIAMRSILTTDVTADNEGPYFNDLTPIGSNTDILSPFSSSGSQGTMSNMSPMSTSPLHIPDDFINLTNAETIFGMEASLSILVQPVEKFRFRYKSEMVGTHGSLNGLHTTTGRKRSRNSVPTVQLHNFLDKAIIRCTLVTADEDFRIPHAHKLVRRVGNDDIVEPHYITVSAENDFTAAFNSMGIIHTARRNVKDELIQKLHYETLEERKRSNVNATLSVRDEAQIKADADNYQKFMNLNSVALCFQGFIKDEYSILRPITAPVYSNPINNLKSALTGELKICRIDKHTSSCEGGEEIFIFVEKVSKKNIKIKFFELDDDDIEIWIDYGRFSELDVHHQYAMVFRAPPFKDRNITSPKEVFIQLERPSDGACSEPIKFTYKPSDRMIGRKRTRVSHSNSTELAQMTFSNPTPSTNIPLTNMHSSNDSADISKEIKKMLDDRCSSSDFRSFVECMDLEGYEKLLDQDDDKLTYDGAPNKKDDKLFAKDVIIDTIKSMKIKPNEAKDIIKKSFKDRTTYGDTPLHCALRHGQKDNVKRILMFMSTLNTNAEELMNIRNSSGKTPLHYAASQDQPEITEALLMLGADPNITDHYGQMPLHKAVKFPEANRSIDILLSEKDINIEANTDLGWSPLQLAAKAGSHYAVRSLVRAGADVNNTDMTYGRTALHIAVEGSHKDIVEFLLKNTNIDVNKRNFSGNTALHIAIVTPGTKAKDICALLLKYGADPHIRNYNRESSNTEEQQTEDIKLEVQSEDENIEECTGQSSFDLASNKPDILQLVSGQSDMLIESTQIKEENIEDTHKVWLDTEQEKQLANILDETKGWKELAQHFNFKYLMNTFKNSSSASLLLLNYIAIQTSTSLSDLRNIMQDLGIEDAVIYMDQILCMK